MPNWCENQLEISGSKESIARIVKVTRLDKEAFDFNGILPMAIELQITSGSSTDYAYKALYGNWEELLKLRWLREELLILTQSNLPETREELIYLIENECKYYERVRCFGAFNLIEGRQAKLNEESYGYQDWYQWSIDAWGTKWNACDVYVSDLSDESISIDFNTAWSPPIPIAFALCQQYPDITLSLRYAEIGCMFAGEVNGELGHCADCPADDVEAFYTEHFDPEFFNYQDEEVDDGESAQATEHSNAEVEKI